MSAQPLLSVIIKKPGQIIFHGDAKAVTSVSVRGKFDVLAYHANFIALIKESVTIHQENKEPVLIPLTTGIIKVKDNTVKIILGIETKAS